MVSALPKFPGEEGGEVTVVGSLPCMAPVAPWPKPQKDEGATSSVPAISRELRPGTAERRSNNLTFPPSAPPFSFQRFHRIL